MSQFNLYLERIQDQKYDFLFEAEEDFKDKLFNFIGAMIFASNVGLAITLADAIHYNRIEPLRKELKQKVVNWYNEQNNKKKIEKDIQQFNNALKNNNIKEIEKIKNKYSEITSEIVKED